MKNERILGSPCFWWTRDACAVNVYGEGIQWGTEGEVSFLSRQGYNDIGVRPVITVPVSALAGED